MADTTCAEAGVVDTLWKTAVIGAVAYVGYTWLSGEGVFGKNMAGRAARYASGRVSKFFGRA